MASSASPDDEPAASLPPGMHDGMKQSSDTLRLSFCWLVIALAVFQFSENTVDIDLWGHIVFGREMLQSHAIAKIEPYSWTAFGGPWFNHECFSEICLGGMHALMGGPGVLLLKLLIGLVSFFLSLRLAATGLKWPQRYFVWAVGALAVVEISYGFAARPQIFTALFLVFELILLKRLHEGKLAWAFLLPPLFVLWVNTHGGVLAGYGLLGLAAGATTAQFLLGGKKTDLLLNLKLVVTLWACVVACWLAMLCNPWGFELVRWTIKSVLWLRPEIQEWNPTPLTWDHAALFLLLALTAFAWLCTTLPRRWWELAACGAFAVLALRAVRNAPLCGLVLLALMPRHLASALNRFRDRFARVLEFTHDESSRKFAVVLFTAGGLAIAIASFTLHKEHPFTMEVPSSEYPNQAISFIAKRDLRGKMLVFFNWGEMVIFHLPNCPVSIDGRLDTCYPQPLIKAHWKFYNGEPVDATVLNIDAADFALLPGNLAGTAALAKRPGWKVVYYNDTAVLLARDAKRFPPLAGLDAPIKGEPITGLGREPLANRCPRWP